MPINTYFFNNIWIKCLSKMNVYERNNRTPCKESSDPLMIKFFQYFWGQHEFIEWSFDVNSRQMETSLVSLIRHY